MSTFFFNEHAEGCTPLMRCIKCETIDFWKGKLSPSAFDALMTELRVAGRPIQIQRRVRGSGEVSNDSSIDVLELKARTSNCLKEAKIHTLDVLEQWFSASKPKKIRGFGRAMRSEVEGVLRARGLLGGGT